MLCVDLVLAVANYVPETRRNCQIVVQKSDMTRDSLMRDFTVRLGQFNIVTRTEK
jgi:hypothetical protein